MPTTLTFSSRLMPPIDIPRKLRSACTEIEADPHKRQRDNQCSVSPSCLYSLRFVNCGARHGGTRCRAPWRRLTDGRSASGIANSQSGRPIRWSLQKMPCSEAQYAALNHGNAHRLDTLLGQCGEGMTLRPPYVSPKRRFGRLHRPGQYILAVEERADIARHGFPWAVARIRSTRCIACRPCSRRVWRLRAYLCLVVAANVSAKSTMDTVQITCMNFQECVPTQLGRIRRHQANRRRACKSTAHSPFVPSKWVVGARVAQRPHQPRATTGSLLPPQPKSVITVAS